MFSISAIANAMEEAAGLQRLVQEFKMTHQQAADAVGRSRSAATNLLRLLNLAKPVQGMVMEGVLEMGHGRALLAVREDEIAAEATGVNTTRYKVTAFVFGAPAQMDDRHPPLQRIPRVSIQVNIPARMRKAFAHGVNDGGAV